jgi:hypothetical protein
VTPEVARAVAHVLDMLGQREPLGLREGQAGEHEREKHGRAGAKGRGGEQGDAGGVVDRRGAEGKRGRRAPARAAVAGGGEGEHRL